MDPGGEVIPTNFSKKVKYLVNKFGHGNKEKTDDGNKNPEANDATATAKIETSPEEKSDTKSKVVIAEVHNSEAAEEDEVSAASFRSSDMSPTCETEAEKFPASAQSLHLSQLRESQSYQSF